MSGGDPLEFPLAMFRPSVFFVDDEPNILSAVARLFRDAPVEPRRFGDAREALAAFTAEPPAVIVSDYRMPVMDGIKLLERCREAHPNSIRILLTGFVDMDAAIDAINRGSVYRFLRKPWDDSELTATVVGAAAESAASNATMALPAYLGSLIGVDSRESAIAALRGFLGEPGGLGIDDLRFSDPAPAAAAEAPNEGASAFSCPLGGGTIAVGVDEAQIRAFREAGLEDRLASLVETALRGCRIAVESADARTRLVELSERDPLSGLFNRRAMAAKVDAECSRRDRYGSVFSVLLMDVDSFKLINDRYGHAKGDAVIAGLGDVIARCCRTTDIPSRLGGDEFFIALPCTLEGNAMALARRIQEMAAKLGKELGLEDGLTLSIGLAAAPSEKKGIDDLIASADRSMYRVKKSGKNAIGS
jgi:diguanylate cyclase (GGDEF)-like protein